METATNAQDRAVEMATKAWSKKAEDIEVLHIGEVADMAEFFIICTASNKRMADSIVDAVDEHLRKSYNERPYFIEGTDDYTWAILDYGDVVFHVFQPEARDYYRLDKLWSKAPRISVAFPDQELA